jgi:hypothetical protein
VFEEFSLLVALALAWDKAEQNPVVVTEISA